MIRLQVTKHMIGNVDRLQLEAAGIFDVPGLCQHLKDRGSQPSPHCCTPSALEKGFSCSSKRIISATGIALDLFASAQLPLPKASRQIVRLVAKAKRPPWMKRAANVEGSGCRRSIVRNVDGV